MGESVSVPGWYLLALFVTGFLLGYWGEILISVWRDRE